MMGMGLSLVLDDFKRIIQHPKPIIIGLLNQLIVLPILAFGICHLFSLPSVLAIGFMLIAACPGGVTSNLISHISRGDTALSVSLTAISSMITLVTIPLYVGFAFKYFSEAGQLVDVDELAMMLQIVVIVIIPISLGMLIRRRSERFAIRMDRPVRIFSIILFLILLLSIIIKERVSIAEYFPQIGAATIMLNVLSLLIGFYSAKILGLGRKQSITISIESGIQNGTLAIVMASTVLNDFSLAIPAGMYSMLMFVSGGFMMYYFGRAAQD